MLLAIRFEHYRGDRSDSFFLDLIANPRFVGINDAHLKRSILNTTRFAPTLVPGMRQNNYYPSWAQSYPGRGRVNPIAATVSASSCFSVNGLSDISSGQVTQS